MTSLTLPNGPRLLVQAALKPLQGTRFQPTGFPDIGAGAYTTPGGREHLLVESAQSVANRLEATCWDEASNDLLAPLRGLPYVKVVNATGDFLTTSILEAHRINSAYIVHSEFFETFRSAVDVNEKKPLDRRKLIAALARYDVSCLLHGVFLPNVDGAPRMPRALSGFIEAHDVQRVNTGGVKNDRVQASTTDGSEQTAKEGFGNVPFHRTEFTSDNITAYFNIDLEQIRGYRLGDEMNALLFALSLFKIQRFLDSGLRLRTACDFEAAVLEVRAPKGFAMPTLSALTELLPSLIKAAKRHFAEPAVSVATFGTGEGKKKNKKEADKEKDKEKKKENK